MPEIIEYCIKFSISLAIVFLFYAGLLRRLTFYHWNRWYLLVYSAIAFLIAFIDISPFVQQNELGRSQVIQFIPLFDNYKVENAIVEIDRWTIWDWTLLCFVIGVLIMFIRLLIQYFSISRIRSKAKLLLDQPIKVYQVDAHIIPFSFGNSIFINQDLHAEEELKEIIRHEFIHIRQRHSVDMIWGELLCIFNWYNPFAWLIRRAIRQNLEFIADDKLLRNGVDRKQYQYLLLKVIGVSQFSIANQFNFSSLKKRIAMMNKNRSAGLHLVKFLFIVPLVLVLLLAFRKQQSDTIPNIDKLSPIEFIELVEADTVGLPKEFKSIRIIDSVATITLKDGRKEIYNLNSAADQARFEKKYDRPLESILPPPPPPPGSPDLPPPAVGKDKPLPPLPPSSPLPPPVKNLPAEINDFHVKEFTITITRKDGKVETYDLKIKKDLSEFEKKYGGLENLMPDNSNIPAPDVKLEKPVPGKPSAPTKSGLPAKPGAPTKTNVKEAPAKPGSPPGKAEDGDYSELKIDASLDGPGNPSRRGSVTIRNLKDNLGMHPLIIIDGKESPIQNVNELRLDPQSIESISVLKGESAKAYGKKGQNGVIIIETKKIGPAVKDSTNYRDRITSFNH